MIVIFILLDCGNVYFCRLQICEWLSHSSNPCLLSLHLVSSPHPLLCSWLVRLIQYSLTCYRNICNIKMFKFYIKMAKNIIFIVLNPIEERMSKSKHLQFVSSVKPLPYWIAAILWDISMYMVTATLVRYR